MVRIKEDVKYEQIKSLPYLICLSLIWIYVGAFRSWIMPSLSNYLYFAHVPILIVFWIRTMRANLTKISVLSLIMCLLVIFQIFHIIIGNIDLVSGIYGLISYETPLIFISIYNRYELNDHDLTRLTSCLLLTLPVNLVVVYFQVILRTPNLQKVEFTDAALLGTSNRIVRATGTFTSSAGFSFYIIFLWLILYVATNRNIFHKSMSFIFAIILSILTLISGSRTILFFMALNLIVLLFTRDRKVKVTTKSFGFKLIIVTSLVVAYKVFTTSNVPVLYSFFQRISYASRTENTYQRVVNAFIEPFKIFQNSTIFGHGLGSFGRGSLGYRSNLWVENDLSKNILECGLVIGGFVIVLRLIIAARFVLLAKQYWVPKRTESLMAAITFVPIIVSGQITNQGSLLLGLCLCASLVLKLIQSGYK